MSDASREKRDNFKRFRTIFGDNPGGRQPICASSRKLHAGADKGESGKIKGTDQLEDVYGKKNQARKMRLATKGNWLLNGKRKRRKKGFAQKHYAVT